MTRDLFGLSTAELYEQTEMLAGQPAGVRLALAELREKWERARISARLRPRDGKLQQRAAQAEKDYLQLRDRCRGFSRDELRAERIAEGCTPLPTDNAELFALEEGRCRSR